MSLYTMLTASHRILIASLTGPPNNKQFGHADKCVFFPTYLEFHRR